LFLPACLATVIHSSKILDARAVNDVILHAEVAFLLMPCVVFEGSIRIAPSLLLPLAIANGVSEIAEVSFSVVL
jgi:hypothetical protein